jgi:hypothetical protein
VTTLTSELNDSSPVVRERAATELGEMGIEAFDALDDLKRLASDDPDDEVKRASRIAVFNVRGGHTSPWEFTSGIRY